MLTQNPQYLKNHNAWKSKKTTDLTGKPIFFECSAG